MQTSAGHHLVRLLGIGCAAVGILAWARVAWRAVASIDSISSQSDEGGRLLVWGLTGTLLMIAGAVLLHVAASADEREEQEEQMPR